MPVDLISEQLHPKVVIAKLSEFYHDKLNMCCEEPWKLN